MTVALSGSRSRVTLGHRHQSRLAVNCTNWEKFFPLALEGMGNESVLSSGMALRHCGIGSYRGLWPSKSGIARAIEFTEVTAKSPAESGLVSCSSVMLILLGRPSSE